MHGLRRFSRCRAARAALAFALAGLGVAPAASQPAAPYPPAQAAPPLAPDAVSPLRLSGFATLGVVDSRMGAPWVFRRDSLQPPGPDGGLRTRVDSRLGLQANLTLSPQLEAITQIVLKPQAEAAPAAQRLEWALLAWRPAPDWTLRAGRVSNDMRLLSEYTNVGFAYPWVRPSTELYGAQSLTSVDGVDMQKAWWQGSTHWRVKLQLGQIDLDAPATALGRVTVRGRDMVAATVQRERDGLLLKASLSQARITFGTDTDLRPMFDLLEAVRRAPIASVSAEAAALRGRMVEDAFTSRSLALGLQYSRGPWLSHAELAWTRVEQTDEADLSAHASLGYRIGAVTVFGAAGIVSPRRGPAQAPVHWAATLAPLVGPEQATAAQAAGTAAAGVVNALRNEQRSLSLGLRWDVHPQVALKAQVDHFRAGARGAGPWGHRTPEARRGNVLSLAVDTVF